MSWFKQCGMKFKLMLLLLLTGLVPLLLVGWWSCRLSSESLVAQSFEQLKGVRENKVNLLQEYLLAKADYAKFVSSSAAINSAIIELESIVTDLGPIYSEADFNASVEEQHTLLVGYAQSFADMLLATKSGVLVFSAVKKAKIKDNIFKSEALKNSGLRRAYERAMKTGMVVFEDFSMFNGQPILFIAAPIKEGTNNIMGVILFEVPSQAINKIMLQREGMGKTGEAYIVGKDHLMRSDSFLKPDKFSVVASMTGNNKVDTLAVTDALKGGKGEVDMKNYLGDKVLSSYSPFPVFDLNWIIAVDINQQEVNAPINKLLEHLLILSIVISTVVVFTSWKVSSSIANSLRNIFQGLRSLSVAELEDTGEKFKRIVDGMRLGAEGVALAASQVFQFSNELAEGTLEQASNLENTTESLQEIAKMTKQSDSLIAKATVSAESGAEVMARMGDAIHKIEASAYESAKIVKVIDEIAFQTNLLALNAAVEAARAGDAGQGFAVVAEEVRNLAQRSAAAAKRTAEMIEGSLKDVTGGVTANKEIDNTLKTIIEFTREISAASKQNLSGIDGINHTVEKLNRLTQSNAKGGGDSASASEKLSAQARELNDLVVTLSNIVNGDSGLGDHCMSKELVVRDHFIE